MKLKVPVFFVKFIYLIGLVQLANAQHSQRALDDIAKVYNGAENFSLDIFERFIRVVGNDQNLMISPFSAWRLLSIITEGAVGRTYDELTALIGLDNLLALRDQYKHITGLLGNANDVQVKTGEFIFTDLNQPILNDYERVMEQYYDVDILPIDYTKLKDATLKINGYIRNATNNQIPKAVHPTDIINSKVILVSTLFFQGQWTSPFNKTFTQKEKFFNELEETVGEVDMMFQRGVFPFVALREIDSHVLELPYGANKEMSMIFMMPRKGVTLHDVFKKLKTYKMERVYEELAKATIDYEDDEVEVHIPKFSFNSDFLLNPVLMDMGLNDAFDSQLANFSKLSVTPMFLSRVLQASKIIVDEEGTVAASFTAGVFANKATPPRFYCNRPFAFMIVEKSKNLILFMGLVRNPKF